MYSMKKSEKLSVVSAIGLLIVAALFLVALLIRLLPFSNGSAVPFFGGLGSLLFGAYGYSSLLIPCFSRRLTRSVTIGHFFAFRLANAAISAIIHSPCRSICRSHEKSTTNTSIQK